ncbi:MAG: triose-phosphate isomerase [Aquificaceae bacterium]|nr:triose-phosphate isomerase [Aquificaceae bacterium]MCX8060143.1 triose-phosphate isomerase [Aquificaceae bacterium]MDW8097123.1 triose-phosphate isomerase [Aquificaceae bacterium]
MKLIAANWKMNMTPSQTREYVEKFLPLVEMVQDREVLLCPPFTSLCVAQELLRGSSVKLGAQNCYHEPKGAFTGEVSIDMLKELGVSYVIVGHSERRWLFGESDELINKKLTACLKAGMRPILCVGERLEEREAGLTLKVVETQIRLALSCLEEYTDSLDIAYEPVWAIGSGNPATPEDVQLVHAYIKDLLRDINAKHRGESRVLYGGSVNPTNAGDFLHMENVEGLLVGGASLNPETFSQIVKSY